MILKKENILFTLNKIKLRYMVKKGISPLIAIVLLIAVTMTIAGIISFWTTSFVRKQVEEFERESEERECSYANFRVFSCGYDENNRKIIMILENIKSVELKNLTAFVIYINKSIIPEGGYSLGILEPNVIKSYELENVGPDYDEILITTHCPTVRVTTSC